MIGPSPFLNRWEPVDGSYSYSAFIFMAMDKRDGCSENATQRADLTDFKLHLTEVPLELFLQNSGLNYGCGIRCGSLRLQSLTYRGRTVVYGARALYRSILPRRERPWRGYTQVDFTLNCY